MMTTLKFFETSLLLLLWDLMCEVDFCSEYDVEPRLSLQDIGGYKEQKELEQIEKDLESLNEEKAKLEAELNSGTLPYEELQKASRRIGEIIAETETRENRWLELSCMV